MEIKNCCRNFCDLFCLCLVNNQLVEDDVEWKDMEVNKDKLIDQRLDRFDENEAGDFKIEDKESKSSFKNFFLSYEKKKNVPFKTLNSESSSYLTLQKTDSEISTDLEDYQSTRRASDYSGTSLTLHTPTFPAWDPGFKVAYNFAQNPFKFFWLWLLLLNDYCFGCNC